MASIHKDERPGPGGLEEEVSGLDGDAGHDQPPLASGLRTAITSCVGAGRGSSLAPGRGWRLIWCYERCYKQENEEKLRLLERAAAAAGGALLCFRKANKFVSWCGKAEPLPYILLTDWREVKPCHSLLDEAKAAACRPALTVVLCEAEPKFYVRAAAWAESRRPGADPVHVCNDVKCLLEGLDSLHSEQLRGGLGPGSHWGTPARAKQPRCQAEIASEVDAASGVDETMSHAPTGCSAAAPAPPKQKRAPADAAPRADSTMSHALTIPSAATPPSSQRGVTPLAVGEPPLPLPQPAQLDMAHSVGMTVAVAVQVLAVVGSMVPLLYTERLFNEAAPAEAELKAGDALVEAWVRRALSHYGMTSRLEVEQLLLAAMPEVYEE